MLHKSLTPIFVLGGLLDGQAWATNVCRSVFDLTAGRPASAQAVSEPFSLRGLIRIGQGLPSAARRQSPLLGQPDRGGIRSLLSTPVVEIYRPHSETQESLLPNSFDSSVNGIHLIGAWRKQPLNWNYQMAIQLRERLDEVIVPVMRGLNDLGFLQKSKIHIVVEASPRVLLVQIGDSNGTPLWRHRQGTLPGWARSGKSFGYMNQYGQVEPLERLAGLVNPPADLRYLVLTAISGGFHSIDSPFILAHEFAHNTEPDRLLASPIWREVRADVLVALVTSETELRYPFDFHSPSVGHETSWENKPGVGANDFRLVRSLSHPTIEGVKDIVPEEAAYHINSQIISSALYQAAQRLGQKTVVDFIHWMDRQSSESFRDFIGKEGADLIEDMSLGIDVSQLPGLTANSQVAKSQNAILSEINMLGLAFWRWSQAYYQADSEGLEVVARILTDRGILEGRLP